MIINYFRFFKVAFITLLLERSLVCTMFDTDALLEYLSSPEGINKNIIVILIIGALNAIFIIYSVRSTYGIAKKERKKQQIQQAKIDKLSPKKE